MVEMVCKASQGRNRTFPFKDRAAHPTLGSTAPVDVAEPGFGAVSFQLSTYIDIIMHTYIPLRLNTYLVIFQSTSHFLSLPATSVPRFDH